MCLRVRVLFLREPKRRGGRRVAGSGGGSGGETRRRRLAQTKAFFFFAPGALQRLPANVALAPCLAAQQRRRQAAGAVVLHRYCCLRWLLLLLLLLLITLGSCGVGAERSWRRVWLPSSRHLYRAQPVEQNGTESSTLLLSNEPGRVWWGAACISPCFPCFRAPVWILAWQFCRNNTKPHDPH